MSRGDTASQLEARFQEQVGATRRFFEPQLRMLGLSEDQIEKQTLDELKVSLDRVNDAIQHPESFGTLRLRMTANSGAIIVQAESEAHIEIGVLPILLERKRLIIERIRLLTPQEQIRDFRDEIIDKVEDPTIRSPAIACSRAEGS